MAKILRVREQRVQYFYDTDFLGDGAFSASDDNYVAAEKHLFANTNLGNSARTNMPAGGFLTGDQTFVVYAVRHEVFFSGVNGSTQADKLLASEIACWCINLSTFQLMIDAKSMFEGPISMTPAGGGPWGYSSDSASAIVTNGEPQNRSIYVLPLPIAITQRQGIDLVEKKTNLASLNIIDDINEFTGRKLFRAYLDGFNTRNVQ